MQLSLWGACISLWFHRPKHAFSAWDLKFQVCLRYTHRHLKIIDCLSLFTVPATSAAQNSLLFFFFLLRLLTELISKQGRPWAIYFTTLISMDIPQTLVSYIYLWIYLYSRYYIPTLMSSLFILDVYEVDPLISRLLSLECLHLRVHLHVQFQSAFCIAFLSVYYHDRLSVCVLEARCQCYQTFFCL
jgi:hypothetical protein